ncbi:MAG TPA: hypothetical protein VGF99_07270 [Myxococcota bacterium]
MTSALHAGQHLLALLANTEEEASTSTRTIDELRARFVGNDGDLDELRQRLLLAVQEQTLLPRVHSAIADDVAVITLADGSSLSRADAERALVAREERRVYLPLRGPMLAARQQVRDPIQQRLAYMAASLAVLPPTASPATSTTTVARLTAFLAASADAVGAVVDALGHVGHVAVEDALALDRALDLPVPALFNDAVVVELVRATRDALPDAAAARLQRRRAPRALNGHVVVDDVARLLWAPTLRATGHHAQLRGLGRLYARLAGIGDVDAVDVHGAAIALQLASPAVRRALDVGVRDAERVWRHALCAAFIEARLHAATAVAALTFAADPEQPARDALYELRDRARSAARVAAGLDPGAEVIDELLAPPWPDGLRLRGLDESRAREALVRAQAATTLSWWRDHLDGALLRRHGLLPLQELPTSSATITTADEATAAGRDDARAWADVVGEVL